MKYTEQYKKNEYLTDKCGPSHTYGAEIYDDLFEPIQHTVRNYLEIGSQFGGSTLLARDYFTRAIVWTIDIAPPNHRIKDADRIIHLTANAYQRRVSDMFQEAMDIIIDDASHNIEDQQKAIELYLPKLAVGGYFIIEDIEAADISFKLFDKKVDDVYEMIKSRGNAYLEYDISTYKGPPYFKNIGPAREKYALEEIEKYGMLKEKLYNDNLYIVRRVK